MKLGRTILFCMACAALLSAGCETLRESKPILPVREYEKMIVGRLDADYIGTKNCLSACHFHDRIKRDFDASTMGAQMSDKTSMPLVDCESCHGPGSLAVEGLTPEKVAADAKEGKQTACKHETFIDIKKLPAQAQSLICLKCHTANATFNLHNWNAGEHNLSDVSCSDCHKVHIGPDLKVKPKDIGPMCETCHRDVQAQFALPSHHPLPEQRVFCTDCHDAHATTNEKMLKKQTIKETCGLCHADKEGPFLFGHGETMEDCRTCHSPHGSPFNNLLTLQEPFICLQCHAGHDATTSSNRDRFYTRCSDCHSQIHGTDAASASGRGRFTR